LFYFGTTAEAGGGIGGPLQPLPENISMYNVIVYVKYAFLYHLHFKALAHSGKNQTKKSNKRMICDDIMRFQVA
jgi:hypothetical protein